MTIRQLLTRDKASLSLYVLGCFLTAGTGISFTFALSNLLSIFVETTSQGIWYRIGLTILFIYTPILLQFISRRLRIKFMNDTILLVRKNVFNNMLKQSYAKFRQQPQSSYMSRLVSDINLFEKDFFLSLLNIIYNCGNYLAGVIILVCIEPSIIISLIPISILMLLVAFWFEPKIKSLKLQTQQANINTNVEISNILNGLNVIKLYQVESHFLTPFKIIIRDLEVIKNTAFKTHELHEALNYLISFGYQILTIVYSTYLFAENQISLPALLIIFNLMGQMVWAMTSCFSFMNRFKAAIAVYNNMIDTDDTIITNLPFHFKQQLQVQNLSYQYQEGIPVLQNLNLNITPGDKVLITGPSGTGKTTLLDCLTQNLTNFSGNILYDGIDIKNITDISFLQHCGYIRQQHFLFDDTIKNNIVLTQEYDETLFNQVITSVDLSDWLASLPDKQENLLTNNGSNISGGQRQRLSIARALYHQKQVLFVDEPSASLDDTSALAVYQTLLSLPMTVICVSHRHLDYLKHHVDQIIDLKQQPGGIL